MKFCVPTDFGSNPCSVLLAKRRFSPELAYCCSKTKTRGK